MKKIIAVGLCFYLVWSIPAIASQQRPLPLGDLAISADSLGAMVLGQNIEFMMRDGTYVAGLVLRANQEEISVDVKKSEPKGLVRGSNVPIPTANISMVYMKKSGTVAAPVALGIVGGVLGFIGGFYVGYRLDSEHMAGILCIAGAAGGASGGAVLGRQAVRKTVTISVTAPSK